MTETQRQEKIKLLSADASYKFRKFRKECVTQGIVEFIRDNNSLYKMKYRGSFVCYLYCVDKLKLMAVWNTIITAEKTFERIGGINYESN